MRTRSAIRDYPRRLANFWPRHAKPSRAAICSIPEVSQRARPRWLLAATALGSRRFQAQGCLRRPESRLSAPAGMPAAVGSQAAILPRESSGAARWPRRWNERVR